MDEFNYLAVLVSIILGLRITQRLSGFGRWVESRFSFPAYAPTILWSMNLRAMHVQTWWSMYGMRHHAVTQRHWFFGLLTALLALGDGAIAEEPDGAVPRPVEPGHVFASRLLNVTAPNGEGWLLIQSSSTGLTFARKGAAPDETFAASVTLFALMATDSREEFEALIVEGTSGDLETRRFTTSEFTHQYSDARGYPCIILHNLSLDRQALLHGGKKGELLLENEHLYCRHPAQTDTGFAITYSHRGTGRYPGLRSEAEAFIDGVQVPPAPADAPAESPD